MICQHGREEYAIASFSDKIVAKVRIRQQSVSPEPADSDWYLWSAPETTWDGHLIPSRASSWQTSRSVPTGRITSYFFGFVSPQRSLCCFRSCFCCSLCFLQTTNRYSQSDNYFSAPWSTNLTGNIWKCWHHTYRVVIYNEKSVLNMTEIYNKVISVSCMN